MCGTGPDRMRKLEEEENVADTWLGAGCRGAGRVSDMFETTGRIVRRVMLFLYSA